MLRYSRQARAAWYTRLEDELGEGGEARGHIHSVASQLLAMEPVVYTRGDLVKNFPKQFSKAALVSHFSSEYVKVIGCSPDFALMQSLAIHFRKLWQSLKKKDCVLSSARRKAFLSVILPVPILEKDSDKKSVKEREKESEKDKEKESPKPRKPFGELSSRGKRYSATYSCVKCLTK